MATVEEKIDLLIAQSASFSLIPLWKNADFEHLKESIENLVKEEREKAIEEFSRDFSTFLGLHNLVRAGTVLSFKETKKWNSIVDKYLTKKESE